MIRFYGEKPYRAAVIHGGPGDIGGMRPVAERLGKTFGVMEPIQSQYTTIALVMDCGGSWGFISKNPSPLSGIPGARGCLCWWHPAILFWWNGWCW